METRLPEMEENQAHLVSASGYLVGASPGSLLTEFGPVREVPRSPGSTPVNLSSELTQRRLGIHRAEARLHATTASIDITKTDFYPRITFNGNLGFESLQLSSLGDWDHRQLVIGPVFSLPIFEGGRLRGCLGLREAQQQGAIIGYQRTVLCARWEVDDVMHDYAANQCRQERLGKVVAQNHRTLQSVCEQHRTDVVDFFSMLDSQRQLSGNQEQQVVSDEAVSPTLVNLYKALGGDWSPTSDPASGRDDTGRGPVKELRIDLLHGIRALVRAVEYDSFIQTTQVLGTSLATVPRQVAGLEQALSAHLLQCSTRSVVMTESGLRCYEHCKQILRTIAAATADVEDNQSHASGRLRPHVVTELNLRHLMPLLVDYLDGHPDVSVDLTLAQDTPALLKEGLDVLIASGWASSDLTLVARDLGQTFSVVYATPEYLTRHGMSRVPEGLLRHRYLNVAAPSCPQGWVFVGERGEALLNLDEVLKVNPPETACAITMAGLGVYLLPGFVAAHVLQEGGLLRPLPDRRLHVREVFVLYSSRRYLDAKTRTQVDFLKEHLPLAFERDRAILGDRRYWAGNPTGIAHETTT